MQTTSSPLQGHAPALPAASPPIIVTPPATPVPADPGQILAKQAGSAPKKRPSWLLWGIGGAVVAQMIMPYELTPTVIAGRAAAGFYSQIMGSSTDNTIVLAQMGPLAQRVADLEARRAEALGQCMWAGIMGPGGNQLCRDLVEQRFQPSIREARDALASAQSALRRR